MNNEHRSVFISYVTPDRERVVPFADFIATLNIDVWVDYRKIKPGQNWEYEIRRGLNKATIIIVFLSNNSINRRGYAQKEIRIALENYEENLISDIYIIPVLLDDDTVLPTQLKDFQFVRASDQDCYEKLKDAVAHQLSVLGEQIETSAEHAAIKWTTTTHKDLRDGIPGYECEFQIFNFYSDRYPLIGDVTAYVRGAILKHMMEFREAAFEQEPQRFNFGQDRYYRISSIDAACSPPKIVGRVLSLSYSINYFRAMAAHPNLVFETFCFILDPVFLIRRLDSVFKDQEQALQLISELVRAQLLTERTSDEIEGESYLLDAEWVNDATESWDDFRCFTFQEKGIEFLFAPYQVAAYVFGPHSAFVPYEALVSLLKEEFRSSLELESLYYAKLRAAGEYP